MRLFGILYFLFFAAVATEVMGQEIQIPLEVDCAAAIEEATAVEAPKQIDEWESLMESVAQLSLEQQTAQLNTPLLPWTLEEVSLRLAHGFWGEIQLMPESYKRAIDMFTRETPEVEENYSLFVSFYEQKLEHWETPNKVWDELCKDLARPVLKGESPLEQAQYIQLSLEVDKLKQQCLDSYSKLVGMRLRLDELNLPIDRILDQRIQRLINQP